MATDLENLVVRLEAQIKSYENEMKRARRVSDSALRDVERSIAASRTRVNSQMESLGQQAVSKLGAGLKSGLGGITAGIVAGLSIDALVGYADQWTNLGNKLKATGLTTDGVADAQERIVAIAKASRTDIASVGDLYAKLSLSSKDLGASQQDVAIATEVVAKALKMGGATASETSAAVLQLGQALASGTLQGDELRSLMENAPQLGQIIAREFGVSVGELKKLGAEGQLAAGRVLRAIVNAAPQVNATFQQTTRTFGDSVTEWSNAVLGYIGQLMSATEQTGAFKAAVAEQQTAVDELRKSYGLLAEAQAEQQSASTIRNTADLGRSSAQLQDLQTTLRAVIADFERFGVIGLKTDDKTNLLELMKGALDGNVAAADRLVAEIERLSAANLNLAQPLAQIKALADGIGVAIRQTNNLKTTLAAGSEPVFDPKLIPNPTAGTTFAQDAAIAQNDPVLRALQGQGIAQRAVVSAEMNKTKKAVLDAKNKLIADIRAAGGTIPDNIDQTAARIAAAESSGGGKGGGGTTFDDIITRSQERIAALREEQNALSRSTEENARAAEALRLYNETKQAGIPITDEMKLRIDQQAKAYANQKTATDAATESQRAMNDVAIFAGQALSGFFSDIVSGGKNASEALMNLTKKLADMAIQAMLIGQGPLAGLFGMKGENGNVGGLIGSLFSLFPGKAIGGPVSAGSPYLVGEKGPEIIIPGRSGMVVPNDIVRRADAGGGGGQMIQISQTFTADANPRELAAIAATIKAQTMAAVRDATARGR